jgi:outer membrane receptor protein involved in Fe transport
MRIYTNFLFALLCLFTASLFAQTGVGKLSGKVVDAETQEPLIGANVVVLNTDWGAATDIEGNYFILNIPPGTYEVRFSFVGYAQKTIQEVRVVAGVTYELNAELSTDFTLPDIVVQDRKLFEEKATNTVKVIDADQISRLPVRGVSNIASLQSGVVVQEGSGGQSGNATINVRGGRGSEVLYIVDGVPQNNLYNRSSVTQVSNVAIEQISFQVGGYEAKYGQAQSGIVNVTTKSGQPTYDIFADVVSSSFTDNYGYNLYSGTLSGPIIPGIPEHTFFLSGERQWSLDDSPPAIDYEFKSINKTYEYTPNNPAHAWRLSGKTTHRMGAFSVNLSALYNKRIASLFSVSATPTASLRYIKNNSSFMDEFLNENASFNGRLSQTLSNSTFWNLNVGFRTFDFERYNPFFYRDLVSYGDSAKFAALGATLLGDGRRTENTDVNGVFRPYGYANGLYQRRENDAITLDLDLTSQVGEHLLEIGFGASQTTVRGYGVFAYQLLLQPEEYTLEEKFRRLQPFVYGYDVTGQNRIDDDFSDGPLSALQRPYKPIIGYAYLQDRYELEDLVLNLGLRVDYFDLKSYELVDPTKPFASGTDQFNFDMGDFKQREVDIEFSPRIGIGFPVTESTVFHAQYGRFIQVPELNDVYFGPFDYNQFLPGGFDPQNGFNGRLASEETTQYELGFRQLLADGNAALNITAFYKNIRGLVNVEMHQWQELEGGSIRTAIYPENADFGTSKGLAFSFDISRISYFSLSAQYTFQIAEGTGSSTNSSQTAVFRNLDNLPPKVIAPLDFDQRHTAVVNLDFYVPKDNLGFLEMFNANFLLSYNSGRPYTPVTQWDLLGDNGLVAENVGYINSSFAPGSFRIDLKIEKGIPVGNSFILTPYVWIENLLDTDNITDVYRSTGDPYTTGWLNTNSGSVTELNNRNRLTELGLNPNGFAEDYKSLERNPANFGIPRLIRLGVKVNFTNISL